MKPGCASSATFTPCSDAKRPASRQYGIAFFSHCHSRTSRNSGGHGVVIQFGCFASSESPGQPEKVTTTGTSRRFARQTVFRNVSSYAWAVFLSGWSGLPWHDSALIVSPASVSLPLSRSVPRSSFTRASTSR